MNNEIILKLATFNEEVLQLIDNRDEFTRGDLQGMVEALVRKIYSAND